MKQIISKVIKTVIPTRNVEKTKKQIAELAFNLVKKETEKFSEVTGLEFGGSFAKDTWLTEDADVDIFIKFKKSTLEEKFEQISKKIVF